MRCRSPGTTPTSLGVALDHVLAAQSVTWRGLSLRCSCSIRPPFSPLRLLSEEISISCNRTFRYIYRVTRSMSLQQLEQFIAVAEERHFTRAALRCHIAQSALSTSIRSLEHELGAALFIRSTRRVELSETGRALLPRPVASWRLRTQRGRRRPDTSRRAGSLTWSCGRCLPGTRRLSRLVPDVKVTLSEGFRSADEGRALRRG